MAAKTRALAAYLALNAGKRVGRGTLCDLLWNGQPRRRARQSLRQALSSLRDTFGSTALQCDDDTVLCRADAFACDAWEFATLARSGKLADAERARSLYRGELLAGCDIVEPAFVEWLAPVRDREWVAACFGTVDA